MIIDFHAHVFPDKLAAGAISSLAEKAHLKPYTDGTVATTADFMKKSGVDGVVYQNIAVSERQMVNVNNFAISLISENVFPFGSVYPFADNAFSELERLKNAGIKGVKFHNEYQNFYVDDSKAFPVYEKCKDLGLIMLFHGGVDLGFQPPVKATPKAMRTVAKFLNYEKIVFAHMGGFKMEDDAINYLSDCGIYIDTSFAITKMPTKKAEEIIDAFGIEKTLFGSDCPWDDPSEIIKAVEKLKYSREDKDKIYYKNALKLLNIK